MRDSNVIGKPQGGVGTKLSTQGFTESPKTCSGQSTPRASASFPSTPALKASRILPSPTSPSASMSPGKPRPTIPISGATISLISSATIPSKWVPISTSIRSTSTPIRSTTDRSSSRAPRPAWTSPTSSSAWPAATSRAMPAHSTSATNTSASTRRIAGKRVPISSSTTACAGMFFRPGARSTTSSRPSSWVSSRRSIRVRPPESSFRATVGFPTPWRPPSGPTFPRASASPMRRAGTAVSSANSSAPPAKAVSTVRLASSTPRLKVFRRASWAPTRPMGTTTTAPADYPCSARHSPPPAAPPARSRFLRPSPHLEPRPAIPTTPSTGPITRPSPATRPSTTATPRLTPKATTSPSSANWRPTPSSNWPMSARRRIICWCSPRPIPATPRSASAWAPRSADPLMKLPPEGRSRHPSAPSPTRRPSASPTTTLSKPPCATPPGRWNWWPPTPTASRWTTPPASPSPSILLSPCPAIPSPLARPPKAISAFDLRHNFVLSYRYQLPFDRLTGKQNGWTTGWSISGITRFSTGLHSPHFFH